MPFFQLPDARRQLLEALLDVRRSPLEIADRGDRVLKAARQLSVEDRLHGEPRPQEYLQNLAHELDEGGGRARLGYRRQPFQVAELPEPSLFRAIRVGIEPAATHGQSRAQRIGELPCIGARAELRYSVSHAAEMGSGLAFRSAVPRRRVAPVAPRHRATGLNLAGAHRLLARSGDRGGLISAGLRDSTR